MGRIIIGAFSIILNVMLIAADMWAIDRGINILGCLLILLCCLCSTWCSIDYMAIEHVDK